LSFTADSWTSCACESYTTFTGYFIDDQWNLKSYVLETAVEDPCHTADNLKDITCDVMKLWKIPLDEQWSPVVTTDNARNIVNAMSKANLKNIGCMAHTVNLVTQRAIDVPSVNKLLSRVRIVVAYFHRSPKASAALIKAQNEQELPVHKLIQDVSTRWNSTLEMLERYLEQQAAIYSVVALKDHRNLLAQLERTDELDIEKIVKVLKPMKTITTILSSDRNPCCSMILPIKETIKKNCIVTDDDGTLVKEMKHAIWTDFKDRYTEPDVVKFLQQCVVLDPRYLNRLPEPDMKKDVLEQLKIKVIRSSAVSDTETPNSDVDSDGKEHDDIEVHL
jgi:hypothetical protein